MFILFIFGLIIYAFIDPTGSVKMGQAELKAVDSAYQKAEMIKREVFCEEYRKIVINKDKAPYAYKHCFN